MAGGRGTPAVSVRSLPPFCLLHRWGHFHLSSDRGGRTNRRRGEELLMRTKKRILILCVWDEIEREGEEGQSGLGSDTQSKASEGQWGRKNGGEAKGDKQTWSHSHPCTRVHIAAHHTLEQSAMDKKIIPLSFLECFLLHPLTRSAPTLPPTLRKHWLFSPNCHSPGPRHPDLPWLALYKHSPVLYHSRKSVPKVRRSRPITGVPKQPGVIWT